MFRWGADGCQTGFRMLTEVASGLHFYIEKVSGGYCDYHNETDLVLFAR